MKKLVLAIAALLVATTLQFYPPVRTPAFAGCGADNPNCVVPTPPTSPCDNSNRIANTAWVTTCGGGSGSLPSLPSAEFWIGSSGGVATAQAMSGDCSLSNAGVIICTKTNGTAFGTAATQNTGTGGANVPLLNGNNTWSGSANHTGSFLIASIAQTFPASGLLVGTTDAQTLTNKTLNGAAFSGTISGSPTYSGVPTWSGLSSGACLNGLAINSGNQTILVACPGAATSIQVGSTSILSAASNTLFGPGAVSGGTGTLAAVSAGAGISITPTTIALALNGATLQQSPTAPTGTASTTGVMEGLGKDQAGSGAHPCALTPVNSTRVFVQFTGEMFNNTASQYSQVHVNWGTGTAPSNGASPTGTQVGGASLFTSNSANQIGSMGAVGGVITGLTVGTAYWFDLVLNASADTASLNSVACTAFEIY